MLVSCLLPTDAAGNRSSVAFIPMSDLSDTARLVRAGVDARLAQVLQERRARYEDLGEAATELLDAAEVLLKGGKRMRALLAGLGIALDSHGPARTALLSSPLVASAGAALELYQASALVHDDVIDAALTRRGEPAAHRRLAQVHRDHGWLTEPLTFGTSGAILLGDLLLSACGEEMGHAVTEVGVSPAAATAARQAFDRMTSEVAVGQYLDLRSEVVPLPGPEENPVEAGQTMHRNALGVVRRKSARYSVMYPLLIGALLAGVDPDCALAARLAQFGEEVGIAFQLRDDLLGVLGDPQVTGKPVGDDLREGKRTVLLALTWQRAGQEGRELLRSVLANREASSQDIAQACSLMRQCGAVQAHEEEITAHLEAAHAALDRVPDAELPEPSREALIQVAQALGTRQA
ncbi:polyprenyl synthetase [Actinomyces urogenitalis DSM 15434]|uniref:Polyprenyl synthetase n=3 Tax=Actinomyces urogenitalis TaxID=103621 RepID=C0W356_9ACTO|nr:polyprenyl synthetase [Actinomyces urogenitalis DSM 15434]ETJ02679.1 MAG: Geranylgeranyl pyrophosphate synthase [Actinomyces urogenitalis DORA_12]